MVFLLNTRSPEEVRKRWYLTQRFYSSLGNWAFEIFLGRMQLFVAVGWAADQWVAMANGKLLASSDPVPPPK